MTSDATYTARPEGWAKAARNPFAELCARVERLEHKQRDSEAALQVEPAPSTPAGQGELVRKVAQAMDATPWEPGGYTPEARAAILAVVLWLESQAWRGAADALRREVGR